MTSSPPHPAPPFDSARGCKGQTRAGTPLAGEHEESGGQGADPDLFPGAGKMGAAATMGLTLEGVDLSGGPRGKAEWGVDICILGKAKKPNRFMTWKDATERVIRWHWWNRRAAFEMCRALQAADPTKLPGGLRSLITPLTLIFGEAPNGRRAA